MLIDVQSRSLTCPWFMLRVDWMVVIW